MWFHELNELIRLAVLKTWQSQQQLFFIGMSEQNSSTKLISKDTKMVVSQQREILCLPPFPAPPKKLFDRVCRPFLLLTSNGKRAEILLKVLYSTGEPLTVAHPNNYFCLKMSIKSRLRNLALKQVFRSLRAKPSICSFGQL